MTSTSLTATARATSTLVAEGRALAARLRRLDLPVVLLTADRKPGSKVRRSHEQLISQIGGRIVSWPGAVHAEHLRRPQQVLDLLRSVVAEAETAGGLRSAP
jgi:pimeloyl-ACP methyl ester carboxylesterase